MDHQCSIKPLTLSSPPTSQVPSCRAHPNMCGGRHAARQWQRHVPGTIAKLQEVGGSCFPPQPSLRAWYHQIALFRAAVPVNSTCSLHLSEPYHILNGCHIRGTQKENRKAPPGYTGRCGCAIGTPGTPPAPAAAGASPPPRPAGSSGALRCSWPPAPAAPRTAPHHAPPAPPARQAAVH